LEYSTLSRRYADLSAICQIIADPIQGGSRLFSTYYRVGLYGKIWQELNGKEFIYKEPKEIMTAEVTARLKGQWEVQFGAGKVQAIGNLDVNESELKPEIAYFQIAPVQIYLDNNNLAKRPSPFYQQFNICDFVLEIPFVEGGKKNPGLIDRKKKKKNPPYLNPVSLFKGKNTSYKEGSCCPRAN